MDIKYLNKSRRLHIDGSYYSNITLWKNWWMGFVPAVHSVKEADSDGTVRTRKIASMHMPKKACEDWATLLLNDKTTATVADANSAKWLMGGAESQQTGGLLRSIDFWPNANRLVELAMRSGTGAFVMSIEGITVAGGAAQISPDARICLDYTPAECILPLTVRHGKITEVAFASEVTIEGRSCIYLQSHRLVANPIGGMQYQISNEYFIGDKEDGDEAAYTPAPLPQGMVHSFTTGSDLPWFAVFSPAGVKNIRGGAGLGMAVFSEALDAARHIDLAFDNYDQDIYLGGKKVFYDRSLTQSYTGVDGQVHTATPDALRRQQFFNLPKADGADPDKPAEWHEYNPALRVEDNSKAVQDALDYFSFLVGLGTHHYQFAAGTIATATQYNGDRQDLVQHANRHQIGIESALIGIFRAMLWAGRNLLGAEVDPDTDISINWDDSYITDAETRRARMKDDAAQGFLPKYRYLMEYYGMSEDEARQAVREAADEGANAPSIDFGGDA